ncbi:hypothetical protein CHLRE_12g537450v5 [Chlamydomonas reinhardtii]|uniref:Uncharacterized protein n=1 Tax=Chlamydomonas reinhardtii TaxID=3055 RepID=A0A2K3D591_CHLRE|nr:uncharacterized protein CHLRE_12g537450v5 [Chlamydomonas reinhardtii]PNW75701.1 hypothetical protein CHLRE_12g537450v5 [Chlamydomonas reinhardtii]
MQALRRAVSTAMPGFRRASTTAGETIDKYWAPYFPKPAVTADEAKKSVNKEMVGFMLLGPVGVAFMLYDFAVGLEEEHHVTIPPYPWMRIRRLPGMPWGQDGLFEGHPRVATTWPPEEGAADSHH